MSIGLQGCLFATTLNMPFWWWRVNSLKRGHWARNEEKHSEQVPSVVLLWQRAMKALILPKQNKDMVIIAKRAVGINIDIAICWKGIQAFHPRVEKGQRLGCSYSRSGDVYGHPIAFLKKWKGRLRQGLRHKTAWIVFSSVQMRRGAFVVCWTDVE